MRDVAQAFLIELPDYFFEVSIALLPIFAVFAIFQLVSRRYQKRQIARMIIGFAYTLGGLVLFLSPRKRRLLFPSDLKLAVIWPEQLTNGC